MKATKIMMLAAATLVLAACSSEEDVIDNSTPVAIQINASIARQGETRTTPNYATGETNWEAGDSIGIYVCDSNGRVYVFDKKYVTTEGDGTFTYGGTEGEMYDFPVSTQYCQVIAYYPFDRTEYDWKYDWSQYTTAVDTKVQTQKLDFLNAKIEPLKTTKTINFTFRHTMSQLVLKIKTDAFAGFAATDVTKGAYFLSGLKHKGERDKARNYAQNMGSVENDWEFSSADANTPVEDGTDNVRTYRMILFPQDCSTNVITFKATIDGIDYTCTLNPNMKSGNSYTYTINIKKTGIEVSNCTIAGWTQNVDETVHDATM